MKKSILVYYPFHLSDEVNSGSKIRPLKILQAFKKWAEKHDLNLIVISGDSQTRDNQFRQLLQSGKLESILFCYMENQTIPIWLTDKSHIPKRPLIDWKFLRFLKNSNIPVGLFYRDVYWKFEELYPLKGIKKRVMQFIYFLEEKFYKRYIDTIFLPSLDMGEYVNINVKKVDLPPGGMLKSNSNIIKPSYPFQAIYVGAIKNEGYGLPLLLDSLEIVNNKSKVCELTIVCREEEFSSLSMEVRQRLIKQEINIFHTSGEKLDDLYGEMDFALIPRYKSIYNNFSVPVKLMEYLSNALPIVATNCNAQAKIIENGNYGVVCYDEKNSMAEAIKKVINENEKFKNEIIRSFNQKHSWNTRVEKIQKVLYEERL